MTEVISNRKKVLQGIAASAFNILVSILVAVIQLRLIVSFLPGQIGGVWFLFLSIGALVAFFDFGLAPTLSREISFIVGRREEHFDWARKIADVYTTANRLFQIVSIVVLLVGLIGGGFFLFAVSSAEVFSNICLAWIIFMTGSALNLWGGAVFAGLYGFGDVAQEKIIRSFLQLLGIIAIAIGLYNGAGLIYLSAVWFCQALISRAIGWGVLRYRYPFLKTIRGSYSIELSRHLTKLSARWMITGFGSIILLQTDQLIVASILGTSIIPSYEALLKIMTTISSIAILMVTSSNPFLSMTFAKFGIREFQKNVFKNIRLSTALMILGGAFFAFMGDKIIFLWIGPAMFAGFPTLWALSFVFVLEIHYVSVAISIMSTGYIVLYRSTLVSGFIKIVLSVLLGMHYGIVGIPLGTAIAHLITNSWYAPYVLVKKLESTVKQYLKKVLIPIVLFGSYILFFYAMIAKYVNKYYEGFSALALASLLSFVIGLLGVLFILLNSEERLQIIQQVIGYIRRYGLGWFEYDEK